MLWRGGRLARCGDCTQCRSPSRMHPTRGHSNFELKRLARVVMGILVLAVSTEPSLAWEQEWEEELRSGYYAAALLLAVTGDL